MSWNQRSLGELLEKSGSQRAGKKDYPVLSITMKHGLVDQSEKFKKRVASQDTTTYRVAFKNELVVGFPIDEGVLGFQTMYPAGIVSPAYDIWKLKDEANTHIPFLERYLRSPQARRIYASKMQGAVARRRSLTKNDFLNLEIPFPLLDDQIRIAHLLGKVEGLILQRKQHQQQLDNLLKSVFLEMFGDPVRNENGWELRPCNKVVTDIQSGTSYGGQEKECLDDDEYGVLKISAVTQGYFNPNEFKAVKKSAITKELRFVKKGDLLFSRANTIELVAACCIVVKDSNKLFLPDKLWALTLDKSTNIQYFNYLLKNKSFRNLVCKQASGGHDSMLNISMKKFRSLNIPVPNRDLQNQFAAIVEKIESIKARYQQSLAELENLYGALSQKAFKGVLDLSRVAVTTKHPETHRNPKPLTQGFARQLIAAEILHRYNKNDMTQMKLQKLIHLTEYHAQLTEIQGDYQRQAAGPYDNKLMYGLATGLEKQQWFKIRGYGQKATYSSLGKAGNHQKYLSHWSDKLQKIDEVLRLLGKTSPEKCEIVSTLYAAWNDLLIDGAQITDKLIITEASHPERWHEAKAAIDPTRWPKALDWMREHNLVPTGYGKQTRN